MMMTVKLDGKHGKTRCLLAAALRTAGVKVVRVFNNLTAASEGFVSLFGEIKFGIPSTSIPTN
jgi:hypothetical protein